MFGSDYFGNPYFGQGYGGRVGTITNKALSATVTVSAKLTKIANLSRLVTTSTNGILTTLIIRVLPKLVNARTRILNYPTYTERIFK